MPNAHKNADPVVNHLYQLVGKTVREICHDNAAGPTLGGQKIYGLVFDDGTIGWIMTDAEGNGPGHIEIQSPR